MKCNYCDFDCKGEDFEGLQASMKLKKFHQWCERYEGQKAIPVPELTSAMNELLKEGNTNVVNDIDYVYATQTMWLRNRND